MCAMASTAMLNNQRINSYLDHFRFIPQPIPLDISQGRWTAIFEFGSSILYRSPFFQIHLMKHAPAFLKMDDIIVIVYIYIYIYICIRYITILVHHLMFQYMFIGFTIDDHPIIPLLMNKKHLINWTIVPCKKIEVHHEIYHESIIVISRRKLWDSIAEGTMLGWKKLYIYIYFYKRVCIYIYIYAYIYIYIIHNQL